MKKCSRCKLLKNTDDFHRKLKAKDGHREWCKSCAREYNRSLHHNITVSQKLCSNCKQIKSQSAFCIARKNSDGLQSWCKACDSKEKVRRRIDNGYTVNEKYYKSHEKARHRGMEFSISISEYVALSNEPCFYCGFEILTNGVGLDRIDSKLGYVAGNVVPCCYLCNTMKWNYWSKDEMLVIGATCRQLRLRRLEGLVDTTGPTVT